MDRQRVLLLENDGLIAGVLCDLFEDEGLDVTVCGSLPELQAGVMRYQRAVVVSDSWATGDYQELSVQQRAEIVALAKTAQVVLTTGRNWARNGSLSGLGTVEIVAKPYDLDCLIAAVRAALEWTMPLGEPVTA
jgi:DNA-binding NtrC family response regulator